jgi:hypothetical protein
MGLGKGGSVGIVSSLLITQLRNREFNFNLQVLIYFLDYEKAFGEVFRNSLASND